MSHVWSGKEQTSKMVRAKVVVSRKYLYYIRYGSTTDTPEGDVFIIQAKSRYGFETRITNLAVLRRLLIGAGADEPRWAEDTWHVHRPELDELVAHAELYLSDARVQAEIEQELENDTGSREWDVAATP